MCVVWYSGRGVCVERYVIGFRVFRKSVYITCDYCVRYDVMYCMQFVMSVSMVSWCGVELFLGAMYMLAMVMSLKCFVCIFRSCISMLSVLMVCGVLMCVNVVSDLM